MSKIISMPYFDTDLRRLGEIAAELGAVRLSAEAEALSARIAEGRFYVACIGQFKRGKSTLLNALVGQSILPAAIVPVTAVPTVLRFGATLSARVQFKARPPAEISMAEIEEYVSEEHNSLNARNVEIVEVFVPSRLLATGMCLVDTPGIASVFSNNTTTTRDFIPHIDAALAVIGADAADSVTGNAGANGVVPPEALRVGAHALDPAGGFTESSRFYFHDVESLVRSALPWSGALDNLRPRTMVCCCRISSHPRRDRLCEHVPRTLWERRASRLKSSGCPRWRWKCERSSAANPILPRMVRRNSDTKWFRQDGQSSRAWYNACGGGSMLIDNTKKLLLAKTGPAGVINRRRQQQAVVPANSIADNSIWRAGTSPAKVLGRIPARQWSGRHGRRAREPSIMSPAEYRQPAEQREDLRNIDGEDRVPFLSQAHMIAIVPGTPQEDHLEGPTYVFIEWAPGIVERPYPGSAIWRAVLERSLDHMEEQSRDQSDGQAREDSERHLRGVVDTDTSDSADAELRSYNYFRSGIEADLARFQSLEMWFRWRDHDRVVPGPR